MFEAAIPIAIIAVGLTSALKKKDGLAQNVIIQSIGGCSGAVVAGAIFTLPAIYILGVEVNFWQMFLSSLLGGVLGFLPDVLTATVVGMKADDRSSPWFWGAIALNLLVAGGSTLFYALYRKRQNRSAEDLSSEKL